MVTAQKFRRKLDQAVAALLSAKNHDESCQIDRRSARYAAAPG